MHVRFTTYRRLATTAALSALTLTACGRSGEGLSQDQQQELEQAGTDAAKAKEVSEQNATDIDELEGRVGEVEEAVQNGGDGDGDVQDQIDQLDGDLTTVEGDVAELDGRVGMLEGNFPQNDDDVVVDDREAAGFPSAAPVDNVEQGMSYLNQRLDVQDIQINDLGNEVDTVAGAVSSLEVAFGSDLFTTVENVVNQEINEGNINVEADLSFDPSLDVNPMDNGLGVVQYSAATDYEDAIRALRYANQVKYIPKDADTRLDGLARNYVQEAIDVLDQDVYDVIYGNIAIDLNAGTTVEGDSLDVYVSSVVESDTTLLTNIFDTTYFQDAVTNIITNGGNGGALYAADIAVDATLLGDPADYADVQLSLESLYTKIDGVDAKADANAADIAALDTRVSATETATAGNSTAITNITSGVDTAITNLNTLQVAVNNVSTTIADLSAAAVEFDNTNHTPFDNNNNNDNVQVAIEDLYEEATRINDAIGAIAAGGGTCDNDPNQACTADGDCGAGTCVFAVTDASNVIYNNNGNTNVAEALDDLYTTIVVAQTVINDGTYINAGQDLNVAVEILDAAIAGVAADLDAAEAAIVDLDTRLTTLEATVAANTTAIDANAADIAANTTLIADTAATLQGNIDVNTAGIANNAADIDTNAAGIVDLDTRVTALEDFNNNQLETTIQNLIDTSVNQLVNDRIVPLEDRVAVLEDNQNNFAAYAYILGPSAQTEDGRFEFGNETGIRAATAMCAATFADEANAHMCTVHEVQQAIALGNYENAADFDDVKTWTVTGLSRRHGTIDAFTNADSRRTSCLDFLYNSGDQATGSTLTVKVNEPSFGTGGQNIAGDMIDIRPNEPCANRFYPVLCCR